MTPDKTDAGLLAELPKPETMLTYASVLEKPQYVVKNDIRYQLATGEIIEAACAALRYCAVLRATSAQCGAGESAVARPNEAPEWIWYGEVDGKPRISYGRWPKNGTVWRYKWAETQPTEHDHPETTGRSFEKILASLNYDGADIDSLTVGEIRRALPSITAPPQPSDAGSEPVAWQHRTRPSSRELWSSWKDGRAAPTGWQFENRPLYTSPPSMEMREALEALSLWVTTERKKYRVAGGMSAGGFDNMSPIEIALAKVEGEIDRRVRALSPEEKK